MIIKNKKDLERECKNISILEASSIIKKLDYELKNSNDPGIGLSANQIGIDAKVCIIRTKNKIDLVNPIILEKYDLMEFENEGCLSFPNQWILTKRYNEVFLKDSLHKAGIILVGNDAVVAQHEIDHLYGKTMFEYQIERPRVNDKCWCGSDKKYKKCHMKKIIK